MQLGVLADDTDNDDNDDKKRQRVSGTAGSEEDVHEVEKADFHDEPKPDGSEPGTYGLVFAHSSHPDSP